MKYIVDMPEGWDGDCETCPHTEHNGSVKDGDYETIYNCQADFKNCPLSNAKKTVEAGWIDKNGASMISTITGKPVKLYAVEE